METLKNNIKVLSERQTFLKNQRKTVRLVGERKLEPWEAAYEHMDSRGKLRLMYAAYGLMRGKKFSETENHYPEEDHPLKEFSVQIDKLVSQYEEAVHTDE